MAGDRAFVASGSDGVSVMDVSNPFSPAFLGRVDTPGQPRAVAVEGTYAYTVNRRDLVGDPSYFQVIDISNPNFPPVIGHIKLPEGAVSAAVAGDYAYVLGTTALQVIDVSNPSLPQVVGILTGLTSGTSIAVAGSYAYITFFDRRLMVVDISNPAFPAIAAQLTMPGCSTHMVAVAGTYAYIANECSLLILDISNPTSPPIVGIVQITPDDARWVAVGTTHAYVANGTSLKVVDISNPALPVIVGSVDVPARAVAVRGTYAYVAGSGVQGVLHVVDVSNPAFPTVAGVAAYHGGSSDVVLDGDVAYLAGSDFVVADVSEPPFPRIVGSGGIGARRVVVSEHLVYASDPFDFRIMPGQCPITTAVLSPEGGTIAVPRLAWSHPNPFDAASGPTQIHFDLPDATRASLQMFDVTGRQVRLLVDEVLVAGAHVASWDGRNDRGEIVASGVYFYRLEAGEFSTTRALVKLR